MGVQWREPFACPGLNRPTKIFSVLCQLYCCNNFQRLSAVLAAHCSYIQLLVSYPVPWLHCSTLSIQLLNISAGFCVLFCVLFLNLSLFAESSQRSVSTRKQQGFGCFESDRKKTELKELPLPAPAGSLCDRENRNRFRVCVFVIVFQKMSSVKFSVQRQQVGTY